MRLKPTLYVVQLHLHFKKDTDKISWIVLLVVGDDIVKVFGGELYREWIIDVDEDDEQGDVITVKYEDGDGEDLDTKYCVCAIKLYRI